MTGKYYPSLDETLYTSVLPNGLTVKVLKKTGFTRSLAYFATDFGSIHTEALLDGEELQFPAGIAHFLEHKLFELPGRDVSAEFAALGANVNAFTSFDMTAYYFSATANFESCLRLLLEFVSTPYFPADSVERELGIIDQEIAMNEDTPDSREFETLMALMYDRHPVRIPILGTREDLRRITPQLLETCHRAFYTPANMILCVVGDADPGEVERIAREVLGDTYRAPAEKLRRWEETMTCPQKETTLTMEVAMPTFQLGFKCQPPERGEAAVRLDVTGYLAAELLLGESSPLYSRLYEDGIIDTSFGGGFETLEGCAMLTCGGDCEEPETVRTALLEEASRLQKQGISSEELLRLKRGVMGRRLRDLDSFDPTCYRICAYHFMGFDYLEFPRIYESITPEEITAFLRRTVTPERWAMARVLPTDTQGGTL